LRYSGFVGLERLGGKDKAQQVREMRGLLIPNSYRTVRDLGRENEYLVTSLLHDMTPSVGTAVGCASDLGVPCERKSLSTEKMS
jgi:hypothetical protein